MVEPFRQSFMEETYIYFNPISSYVIVQNNCSYCERLSVQSKPSQISLAPNIRVSIKQVKIYIWDITSLTGYRCQWMCSLGFFQLRVFTPCCQRAHSAPLYSTARFNYSLIWYPVRTVVHYFVNFQRRLSSPDVFEFPEKLTWCLTSQSVSNEFMKTDQKWMRKNIHFTKKCQIHRRETQDGKTLTMNKIARFYD